MSSGFNRLTTDMPFTADTWNDNQTSHEQQAQSMHGMGVLTGAVLSAVGGLGTGLNLAVSSLVMQALVTVPITGFSQAVPNNQVSYVWLDFTYANVAGVPVYTPSLIFSVSSSSPGGNVICLGRVTAAAGVITLIESTGRIELARWIGSSYVVGQDHLVVNQATGRVGVGKLPTQGALDVQGDHYISGDHHVEGQTFEGAHHHDAYNIQTLSAAKHLGPADPNIQWLTCNGAAEDVYLPDPTLSTAGDWFEIVNAGDAGIGAQNHNLTLKTFGGVAITGGAIVPGDKIRLRTYPASGSVVAWPTTATAIPADTD